MCKYCVHRRFHVYRIRGLCDLYLRPWHGGYQVIHDQYVQVNRHMNNSGRSDRIGEEGQVARLGEKIGI